MIIDHYGENVRKIDEKVMKMRGKVRSRGKCGVGRVWGRLEEVNV